MLAAEKVLLVDDEEDFVEALSARLEARGLHVDVAASGQQALEKIGGKRFDVVIMDLSMPGMDGIETLQQMRQDNPEIQVVLLTGHGSLQKGIEAMKLGAMDFLEKPADIELLLEKVRTAKAKTSADDEKQTQSLIDDILKTKGW